MCSITCITWYFEYNTLVSYPPLFWQLFLWLRSFTICANYIPSVFNYHKYAKVIVSGCLYYLAVLVHIINCLLISVLGISLEKKRQFEQSIANASLCPYERKRNLNDNLKGRQPYKHSFSLSEKGVGRKLWRTCYHDQV